MQRMIGSKSPSSCCLGLPWSRRDTLRRRRSRRGYSLVEIMFVVAIMGFTLLMGAPYLLDEIRKAKIRGVTDQVVAVFQSTRVEAIKRNTSYSVDATDEGISAPGISSVNFVSLGETDLSLWNEAPCFDGYRALPLAFDAQGKADDKRAVCLADGRGNVFQIAVDSIQGTPRIRKFLKAGDAPGGGVGGFYLDGWRWY